MIGFKNIFVEEYHDLKLTQNLSARKTGYHSAKNVVPNGDIYSALENMEITAAADQRHLDQMMEAIHQLMETNKILKKQLKNFLKQTRF